MSIAKIEALIKRSDQLFTEKSLEAALETAKEAYELSTNSTFTTGIIQSSLLLGKIYTTTGKYRGDQKHFPTALQFIRQAEHFNKPPNENGYSIDILLAYGEVFQQENNFEQATQFYQQALDYSEQKQDNKSIILTLCALSRLNMLQNELARAFENMQKVLPYLNDESDNSLKAEVYNQLVQIYIKKQEYSRILDYSEKVLQISRENHDVEKELSALNNIAIYYAANSEYKTAMEYFLEALDKGKNIGYRFHIANSLINIATIYASLFNYKEAIKRYQTVLREYSDVLEKYTLVILYNNLGNIYYHDEQALQAKVNFEHSYSLAEQMHYKEMMAHSLAQLSRAEAVTQNFDIAFKKAQAAQELFKDLGDINGKQINLINLGNIYYHQKQLGQAIKLTSQGIVTSKRMRDDISEIRGYQLLAKIYQEQKDFEKALQYQLIYTKAQEQFAIEQRNRQILDLEIEYSMKEKEKEIEQLTRENEYQALLLEQSDQIAHQNTQLLQANDELRQFAYVASHDLKEPLRMIGSYTQLIERLFKEQIDTESRPFFEFVNEGVIRMNNLLDDLLKYATIGKVEAENEWVKLGDIIDIALNNLRLSIEESKAEIGVEELPEIHSVPSLLIQLFQNLISNAIKFRKKKEDLSVAIFYKTSPDSIIISVRDNGIGISPEFKERIFVIFQRLHTRAQYEGTGIGLAICQKIMQRLGGEIWVESQPEQGATFHVSFPRKTRD